ncbi:hypothetical protein HPB51_000422 [Rhipicephalus microplus]|uniref:Uncharacterized protein n=1 Tax=Rhipicephalus microplus TaxID=6941 RepID=A0A9J6DS37_RHIMP|nr:hypothetical protein HPB51_000422 [Rhipicephalus microplus]
MARIREPFDKSPSSYPTSNDNFTQAGVATFSAMAYGYQFDSLDISGSESETNSESKGEWKHDLHAGNIQCAITVIISAMEQILKVGDKVLVLWEGHIDGGTATVLKQKVAALVKNAELCHFENVEKMLESQGVIAASAGYILGAERDMRPAVTTMQQPDTKAAFDRYNFYQ